MATSANPDHTITLHPNPLHRHPPSSTPIPDASLLHGKAHSSAIVEEEDNVSRRNVLAFDVERQPSPTFTRETDPFSLSSKIKTPEELSVITANSRRKRDTCNPLVITGKKAPSKLTGFYESQNAQIERLLLPVSEQVRQARETNESNQLKYKIAVYGSFAANIILAGLQIYAAISSTSLSLFTTMADAIFDPLSNLTLLLCNRAVMRVDPRKYPAGKARIETAGNIAFCFLMTAVSFILIAFSTKDLVDGQKEATTSFHLPSVIAVAIAFSTKLSLFLYCWALRNTYSQVRILWEDHRNDLFINGFGLLTSVGGSRLRWQLDPAGAIVLSTLIAFLWLRTSFSEFGLLIGVTADTEMQQLITYISMTHDSRVKAIDTVRAWHSGPRLVVEVDVVLDESMTVKESHDIAEELQLKLESLPDVERAYCHIDYETTHKPEHFLKKEL